MVQHATARPWRRPVVAEGLTFIATEAHREGAHTTMEFDYLEITKSSVLPHFLVALFTCWVNPCDYNIIQNL